MTVHVLVFDVSDQALDDLLAAFAGVVNVRQQVDRANGVPRQHERRVQIAVIREGRRSVPGEDQLAILECAPMEGLAVQIDSLVAESLVSVVHALFPRFMRNIAD